jgi:glycosyltransferase involved in cell wall biosynthesis
MPDRQIGGEPEVSGLSIVIPTYRREAVLVDSLRQLLRLRSAAEEIIVVDQTDQHELLTQQQLQNLHNSGAILWLRRNQPSIPAAMNAGLLVAQNSIVLFLDDDIRPDEALIAAHRRAQLMFPGLVAGQVLQPGEKPLALEPGQPFIFKSSAPALINEFMGGNFSIRRDCALALGGFDENFVGAAYRFEAEFAHRYTRRHGPIHFEPAASIDHLQASAGGTRAYGHHLRTVNPEHSVGAYYVWLRTRGSRWWLSMLLRPLRSIRTRHHLRRPWWIPLTLLAEIRGLLKALQLSARGPSLLFPLNPLNAPSADGADHSGQGSDQGVA